MEEQEKKEIIKKLSNLDKNNIGVISQSHIKKLSEDYCQSSNISRMLFMIAGVFLFLFPLLLTEFDSVITLIVLFSLLVITIVYAINLSEKNKELTICKLPTSPSDLPYLIHPFSEIEDIHQKEIEEKISDKEYLNEVNLKLKKNNRKLIYAEYDYLINNYENIPNNIESQIEIENI